MGWIHGSEERRGGVHLCLHGIDATSCVVCKQEIEAAFQANLKRYSEECDAEELARWGQSVPVPPGARYGNHFNHDTPPCPEGARWIPGTGQVLRTPEDAEMGLYLIKEL